MRATAVKVGLTLLAGASLVACADTPRSAPAPDRVTSELLQLCEAPEREGDISVATADELTTALRRVGNGQRIFLSPGDYRGSFEITSSGSREAPIALCGVPESELSAGSGGYTLHLNGADWWSVQGLTVVGGQKGIMLDDVNHSSLVGLRVSGTGQEAVHLRKNSSDNEIVGLQISDTGRTDPSFGEGIYVGTAERNWCRYTNCQPDASDRNVIVANTFGPGITAENIDIKEGTTGGRVQGNSFSGRGTTEADSWVDVKGNDWLIHDNTGVAAPRDGMGVHVIVTGWGNGNRFTDNTLNVDASGFGIRVDKDARNTVVSCGNTATGADEGLTNIDCRD